MAPIKIAEKYMMCFYGEEPLTSMEEILAEDLNFTGPFYECTTAKEYLDTLRKDPPANSKYQIVEKYENGNSVCLIYKFSKPGIETQMAQTFEIKNGKINHINLIFDTNAFT